MPLFFHAFRSYVWKETFYWESLVHTAADIKSEASSMSLLYVVIYSSLRPYLLLFLPMYGVMSTIIIGHFHKSSCKLPRFF